MAIHETLDIEKFDGLGDYASWKDTALTVLKAKRCHGAVLEDKRVQNGRGEYVWLTTANEEEDSTAKLYLAQLLTSDINRYARGRTANELWEKLDSVYSLVNTSTSLDVVADMIKLRMKPGDTNGLLYSRSFRMLRERLRNNDITVDSLMTLMFLSGLNDKYVHVIMKHSATSAKALDFEEIAMEVDYAAQTILSRLRSEERASSSSDHHASAASTPSKRHVCTYCNRVGHTADRCFKKPGNPRYNGNGGGGQGDENSDHSKDNGSKKGIFKLRL
ncbi:hypothetical protein IWW41_006417, partial [Coemansia sp. RSA 2522]